MRCAGLRVAVLGLVMTVAAACTATPGESAPSAAELSGWTQVELPGRFAPAALAVAGRAVWVGGRTTSPRAPRLALLPAADTAGANAEAVPLRPVSPYAANAEIVSLAVRDGAAAALGAVRDGAHSNVRWSVWTGSGRGLQEHPQGFNTFGGPEAGDLVAVVQPAAGPAIVGTWSSRHGLDGAVWLPTGTRWVRQRSAGTVLASTSAEQVSPRAAVSDDEAVIALGSVLFLGTDLRQAAAVFRWPTRSQPWSRVVLPDAGARSEALAATCRGAECWVFGQVEDQIAAWTLGPDGPRRIAEVPAAAVRANSGMAAFRVEGGVDGGVGEGVGAVFTEAGEGRLLLATRSGWRVFAIPLGTVAHAVAAGHRVYAVVENGEQSALWSCDLTTALGG